MYGDGKDGFQEKYKMSAMDCIIKKYVVLCVKIQYLDKLFLSGWYLPEEKQD